MIYGIGLDIIETERVQRAAGGAFMQKIFSGAELEMLEKRGNGAQQIAGGWAVKEAVIKCLGEDKAKASPKEIEVLREASGKPYVVLRGRTKEFADSRGVVSIYVSISNLEEIVAAMAVMETE
jgi:holo-[acyl-carrier protein] synthase